MVSLRLRGLLGVLAGLALVLVAGSVPAGVYSYDTVKTKYADQIRAVLTCGSWPDGDRRGSYRIVEAVVYTQSVLYVQWLGAPDPDSGLVTIRATFAPDELNDDHADISLEDLRCKPLRDGVRVTARAWSGHRDGRGKLLLTATHEPGEASLELRFPRR